MITRLLSIYTISVRQRFQSRTFSFLSLYLLALLFSNSVTAKQSSVNNGPFESLIKKSKNEFWVQPNMGQFNPRVKYAFTTTFGNVYIENDAIVFVALQKDESIPHFLENDSSRIPDLFRQVIRLNFTNGNHNPSFETLEPLVTTINYLNTPNEQQFVNNIPTFGELRIKNIYNGIDLRLYSGEQGTFEFDWLVSNGADYSKIKMHFEGADSVITKEDGSFQLKFRFNQLHFNVPVSYQIVNNTTYLVPVKSIKLDQNTVGYSQHNLPFPTEPLIIDPTVLWATYFDNNSSSFDEYLYAVESDSCGNVYAAGNSNIAINWAYRSSVGFDTLYSGLTRDAIIYKMNSSGTAITNFTYYGSYVTVNDMDIFPNGNILIGGNINSGGSVPTINPKYSNSAMTGFVAVMNGNLSSLSYSSYMPGYGTSWGISSVEVVNNSTYYIAGMTSTHYSGFVTFGAPDSTLSGTETYIARFSGTNFNTLDWATYIGGNDDELFISIKVTPNKSYITFAGYNNNNGTSSTNFPTRVNPVDNTISDYEVFVGTLPNSSTKPSTFTMLTWLGGTNDEYEPVVDADNSYIYTICRTNSTNFPGRTGFGAYDSTHNGNYDLAISKIPVLGSTGSGFRSTYLGGSSDDYPGGIIYNSTDNNLYFMGSTYSTGFPVLNSTPASSFYDNTKSNSTGNLDIVIGSMSVDLRTLTYSTYIGGTNNDYFGATGTLKGTGHYSLNPASNNFTVATTVHSDVGAGYLVPVTGVFDVNKSNTTDDIHLIFKFNISSTDYGDLPIVYENSNPARHLFNPQLSTLSRLGVNIDAELLPTYSTTATGDDLYLTSASPCISGSNDEDGISSFAPINLITKGNYTVSVSAYNSSGSTQTIQGWIDFNGDSIFQARERATGTIGSTSIQTTVNLTWVLDSFVCPLTLKSGFTYARFRITSSTLTDNTATSTDERSQGLCYDGEVEDYLIYIRGTDYGDLPSSYGSSGAIRFNDNNLDNIPDHADALWMGTRVDVADNCSQLFSSAASGDDLSSTDDEDGKSIPNAIQHANASATWKLYPKRNTPGKTAYYGIWIDWNYNGVFTDPTDGFYNGSTTADSVSVTVTAPGPSYTNPTYAHRFVISDAAVSVSNYTGILANGEVEDGIEVHAIPIKGTVYDDQNGMFDATVNGTPIKRLQTTQLYAYLSDSTNTIVDTCTISSTGTFRMQSIWANRTHYVQIGTISRIPGQVLPTANSWPTYWYTTGETYGVNNFAGAGTESGTPNGKITVKFGTDSVTNIRFGLDKAPLSHTKSYVIDSPSRAVTAIGRYNKFLRLNAGSGTNDTTLVSGSSLIMPGRLSGMDYEQGRLNGTNNFSPDTVTFNILPDSSNSVLVYNVNGALLPLYPNPAPVSPQYTYWDATTSRYRIPNFKADSLLLYIQSNLHSIDSFRYSYTDKAGKTGNTSPYRITYLTVLPIKFHSFDATLLNNKVLLNWDIITDNTLKNFELYRYNKETSTYDFIGTVEPSSEFGFTNYEFYDFDIENLSGIVTYQLRGVTYDNQSIDFGLAEVLINSTNKDLFSVFPNPAQDDIAINIVQFKPKATYLLEITDINGTLLYTQTLNNQITRIASLDLNDGVYLIRITSSKSISTQKLVIMHQ
ncbi:MAG: T9SS type A sorting domain-containing protein [Bacteroidota bacterium]